MYSVKVDEVATDLDAPSTMTVSDKYRLFEYSLPFYRIELNTFLVYNKMALADCGDDGYVTLKAMRTHLKTPAWADLENETSPLSTFLLSSAFKNESKGLAQDQICTMALTLFAILHCPGKIADRTEHFFNEIQEGGTAVHSAVSAGDKDIVPVFDKLCGLASFELFTCQKVVDEIYTADECNQMKEDVEALREDKYLEDVFGANSRMESEDWVQAHVKAAKWIYDSAELRKRLFEISDLEARH